MVQKGIIDSAVFSVTETSEKKIEAAKAEKAKAVISRCNIVFVDGEMMKAVANANYQVYFDGNPASIGGAMPEDTLYYEAK